MSVLATVDVSVDDFTFGGVLIENAGLHVRLERVVPLGSTFIPYLWASDDSVNDIRQRFDRKETSTPSRSSTQWTVKPSFGLSGLET